MGFVWGERRMDSGWNFQHAMGKAKGLLEEKKKIESALSDAGGKSGAVFLELCTDLADIIEGMTEIEEKKGKKEHAAFETKVKFSRKIRRKAKDMGRFESEVVSQFDRGNISLEHGRKMAEILKTLRSGNAAKARESARDYYGFISMGERLKAINDELEKMRFAAERKLREAKSLLDLEGWLSAQPPIEQAKIERANELAGLERRLEGIRLERIGALKSMPFADLARHADSHGLCKLGFPIQGRDIGALLHFLEMSGLVKMSASELLELSGNSEQKLRHLGMDMPGFREHVIANRALFDKVASLHVSKFLVDKGENEKKYLASQSSEAAKIVARLSELEGTKEGDILEMGRNKEIEAAKKRLEGKKREDLRKDAEEPSMLLGFLEGKEGAFGAGQEGQTGILGSIRGLFGWKG